jgi:cytochrome c oxidase assembly protein Cox11
LLTFEKVDGELRYFIDNDIVNKLTKDDINEIESLWQTFYKKE